MAMNFTPLTAYKIDVLNGERLAALNRAAAADGIGAVVGLASRANYEAKARDFFAQFDDSEEIENLQAEIDRIDGQIKDYEAELQRIGGNNGID